MRLTKQSNYAIRLLMYCAANPGELSQVSEIAKAYNVSELFLFKILQILVKGGLIKTVRGRNGGIYLSRPAKEITVSSVIKLTEENFAIAECFSEDHSDCPLTNSCGLNAAFSKALKAFFEVLEQTTIKDLQRPTFRERLGIDNPSEKTTSND